MTKLLQSWTWRSSRHTYNWGGPSNSQEEKWPTFSLDSLSRPRPRQGHQPRPPGRGSLSGTPSMDYVTRQWSVVCHDLVNRSQIGTDHYNPLLVYSIHSCPTLRRTLIVNLIYWFAQSVSTLSGFITQPSYIPQVLYLTKLRPNLGLHPYRVVYNTLTILN